MNNFRVWILLLALTAVEVFLAYVKAPLAMMLVALLALSVLKSAYIIGYFMHMRQEKRSLKLAIFPVVILLILALFGILPDAKAQCVMCQRNAAAQNEAGIRRLNRAIGAMVAPPLLMMAAIVWRLQRGGRSQPRLPGSEG
ncbi:MAG: hypothetical protein FJW39_14595 [Acidobacteria bacterium]|nr:hypothetical protein [Acidobacteriota bacterium]